MVSTSRIKKQREVLQVKKGKDMKQKEDEVWIQLQWEDGCSVCLQGNKMTCICMRAPVRKIERSHSASDKTGPAVYLKMNNEVRNNESNLCTF